MFNSLNSKQKIIFFIFISIMIVFIIIYIYINVYKDESSFDSSSEYYNIVNKENTIDNNSSSSDDITIYICGQVKENKVISIPSDSRVIDAIEAVGGLTDSADISNINLAAFLEDGEKIYIPKEGEIVEEIDSLYSAQSVLSSTSTKVNINKASQSELETLPRYRTIISIKDNII